jgi:hypothetical protein
LQTFEHYILERHNLFTDKTLDHIVYIDKQLWDAPDKTLKQKILSDAKEKNNKVIVVYDSATGEKDVIHQPSNSQNLDFATVEVISRDNRRDCLLNPSCSVALIDRYNLLTLSPPLVPIFLNVQQY